MTGRIEFPTAKRGRKTAAQQAEHEAQLFRFYDAIRQIESRLDFAVSARGWCYLMENSGAITKAEFDRVETLINAARKSGVLPIEICAMDENRSFDCVEYQDTPDIGAYLVEANALVVAPQAGRQLFRKAIERYLGDIGQARKEFESRLELPRRQLRERFAATLASQETRS